ncbi:hypothetical protein SDC9_31619 [bioreactor metagenome]|uniref:Uncharacterized protein n=1 Tax=bioreactor metagenome TaxID=1076179 RepID=A0A644V368_9ZZZZ
MGEEKKTNWLKAFFANGWTISIGSTVIGLIIPSIYSSIKNQINIFKGFISVIKSIFYAIWSFLCIQLPIWVFITSLLVLIGISLLKIKILKKKELVWMSYTSDNFKDWLFTWGYSQYGGHIVDLKPICSRCHCDLSSTSHSYFTGQKDYLYCPNCDSRYPIFTRTEQEDIEKLIIYKIKNNSFTL